MSGIAPLDVRFMLALIALPLAWKILSLDLTGLGDLCERPPLFTFYPLWLKDAFAQQRCFFFSGDRTRYMQMIAAALLVATIIRPSRWFLVPAVMLVWVLDTGAALFRFNFFTIDTPLALLVLVVVCPVSLPIAARLDAQPSRDARVMFTACFSYVAAYYILAGIAKLNFDPNWIYVVKVGNYYPISFLWHGQTMPEPVDTIARVFSETMLKHPWLDTLSAIIVLVEQFLWILAPFGVILRLHAGLFSAGYHVLVVLTTGIMFVTWIPIALAVSVPFSGIWRWITRRRSLPVSNAGQDTMNARLWFTAALSVVVACFPSRGTVIPPFYNYLAFGWRYPELSEMKPFYRIGFHDAEGRIQPLPLHHAGFLDFMHVGYLDVSARYAIENRTNDAARRHFSDGIRSLLLVMRPIEANGWLLGSWRAPAHLLSEPGTLEVHKLRHFLILHGTPKASLKGRPAGAHWKICGRVDLNQPTLESSVTLLPECVDEPAN